jgi:hypothetical protein
MRVYALLLGITLTAAYGYAAHAALASVAAANRHASLVDRPDAAPDRLYYGGTLEPITVVATAQAGAPTVVTVPAADRTVRCAPPAQLKSRAPAAEKLL